MDDILTQPATDVARMLRGRELSSRELTEAQLARIEAVNPGLNAVVELRGEQALAEAAAADDATARGGQLGPLHGLPMTIKDSFDVAGLHTTWGNPAFRDHVASADATLVRRLRRAGAVLVGKTNVAFMLGDFGQTANELYGATANPWDPGRTPGGSSGGAAAATAAGLSFLDYGSDLVGSIRIPAGFCGVYGLRPSVGVVPLTGFQLPGPPAGPSDMGYLSAVGPLGRSADDLRAALAVTAGPSGAKVVEGWPDGVDPAAQAESFGFHVRLFFAYQEPGEDLPPLAEAIAHEHRRMAARAAWTRYFSDVDVFLCPVTFCPAFPHDPRSFPDRTIATPEGDRPYGDLAFWVAQPSLPGLPALTTPVGWTSGGLPVGAQVVGPLFEDDTAITLAGLLGEITGGYQPPPG